jgi:hypothetical protein
VKMVIAISCQVVAYYWRKVRIHGSIPSSLSNEGGPFIIQRVCALIRSNIHLRENSVISERKHPSVPSVGCVVDCVGLCAR